MNAVRLDRLPLACTRRVIRRGEIVVDEWRYAHEDPLGRSRALILPYARWQQERRRWWLWDGRLGVHLTAGDPVSALEHDFLRLGLLALDLEGISDAQASRSAQWLRERERYTGELRAVGRFAPERIAQLASEGFDAFELAAPEASASPDALERARALRREAHGAALL